MIRDLQARRRSTHRRAAFTLLEILVVVAIIVILAGVATVSYTRYLADARIDTARASIDVLEKAARDFTIKNGGVPPNSLTDLVTPPNNQKPFVEGGASALIDPWNKQYQYDGSATNAQGDPDPMVFTTNPEANGAMVMSSKRTNMTKGQ